MLRQVKILAVLKTPDKRRLILTLLLIIISTKMAQQRINLPSGSGGLLRYFDEYKSKIRIKPGHIVIMCVVVIVIMLFLYNYGKKILGI